MLAIRSNEPNRSGQPGQAGLRLAWRSRWAGHVRYWDDAGRGPTRPHEVSAGVADVVGMVSEAAGVAQIGPHGGDEESPGWERRMSLSSYSPGARISFIAPPKKCSASELPPQRHPRTD